MHHLLSINGNPHLVTNASPALPGQDVRVTVKPSIRGGGTNIQIRTYGYVGSFILELAALIDIAEKDCDGTKRPLCTEIILVNTFFAQ